jgi:hypothetical protein
MLEVRKRSWLTHERSFVVREHQSHLTQCHWIGRRVSACEVCIRLDASSRRVLESADRLPRLVHQNSAQDNVTTNTTANTVQWHRPCIGPLDKIGFQLLHLYPPLVCPFQIWASSEDKMIMWHFDHHRQPREAEAFPSGCADILCHFRRCCHARDHVGIPWKSIVCMYNITCIWNLVPVYSGQTFCNENVQGQGAPRQKFNENRIP